MQIIRTKAELRSWIATQRREGQTIAFVPTMGALHEGHISLVKIGKARCSRAIASIFVNPRQFGPKEDFSTYPRTEAEDIRMLEAAGVNAIYIPAPEEIYPEGFGTQVAVLKISDELEGLSRPQFFYGVATVVAKLLLQCLPDMAIFGEKDYQQLHVIKRMVADLDIPVKIIGGPTLREPDGLAMSSRNRYLSKDERKIAPSLHVVLQAAKEILKQGNDIQTALITARQSLVTAGFRMDYLELRDAESLSPASNTKKSARLLAAVYLGTTRLIDNIEVTL